MCQAIALRLRFGMWNRCFYVENLIRVLNRRFTVVLNSQALHLLEFLEMNSLLGVSHFTFYNHTLGPRASCVLKHYMNGEWSAGNSTRHAVPKSSFQSRASVSMLPWDLRMRSQKDIRTEGLFAALNDCLYRSMYRYGKF